jgi:hypothetical protein
MDKNAPNSMKQLVEFVVKAIVDYPEDVRINVVESGSTIVIELSVAKPDIGKVIGKQGNMARALRTILSNASTKLRKRTVLQILE